MACKSIFVTATGTDIGKTFVSALLVKKMRAIGLNCGYYKPALSGAVKLENGNLLPGDCDYVVKTAGLNSEPMDCLSYCFEDAVSPHLAAERAGVNIDLNVIKSDFNKLSKKYDYLVVEGAGGITCPFNLAENRLLLPDVIKALGLDVLIVADGGLGTINSALLTVEYAKSHGINSRGIILNNYDKNNFMHIDNKIQVERLCGVGVIATVAAGDSELCISENDLVNIWEK